MFLTIFSKRIIPFALAFILGLFAVESFGQKTQSNGIGESVPCGQSLTLQGRGASGADSGTYGKTLETKPVETVSSKTKPLKIISKPQPQYTDEAKRNCIQGSVVLRVTFFANGTVGNIKVLSGLPNGLTGRAIEAAKKIRFNPVIKKGKPITVTKSVTYNFTIY